MTKWICEHLAVSHKGAKDLEKGIFWSTFSYLSLMFPMGVLLAFLSEVLEPILLDNPVSPSLIKYIGLCVVTIVLMIPFHWLQHGTVFISTYEESASKRITLAERLRKLPLAFFEQKDVSDLTTTIMSDCTGMEHVLSHAIPQLGGAIFSTIIITIMLFFSDWKMALALFWVFPISLVLVFGSKKIQDKAGKAHLEAKICCADGIQECLETVKEIKAYNRKENYLSGLYEKMNKAESAQIKSELITDAFLGSGQAFLRLGLATVILTGNSLLISGETDLLTYFMFLLAATRIYDPLSGVLTMASEIFHAKLQIDHMQEIEKQPVQSGDINYKTDGYDIVFDKVTFEYNTGETVLKNISFTARQGQITALVGPSGSGKSTVAKLAARFWDATDGKITLGGTDISSIDAEALLSNYSIVFQDVVLFDNTVMENIRIGRRDASDEEVIAAAKAARCDEFVRKLPEGFQTVIGENGTILSGGERQRLSIARAILKNAPVILLDEATASLDVESETLVQEAISSLIQGKTVLIIAHRMRTVTGADKIVVLENGEIVQQGTSAELYSQEGLYRKMVNLQRQNEKWTIA